MTNKKEKGTYNETLNKSEAFFTKYGKSTIIAIVVIIVIAAGYVAYKNYIVEPRENEASTLLSKSQDLFNQQQYDKAIKDFINVQSNFNNTEAGNLSNLYIGLCYAHMQKPNWKKALENVEKFSTSNDQTISPASQMALGDIYANNNQNDKAVEYFKKAAEMANSQAMDNINLSIAPLALKKAGIILESINKKDDALKIYEEIKKNYINSPISQDIDKYIERAKN